MNTRKVFISLLLPLVFALSACGGDDEIPEELDGLMPGGNETSEPMRDLPDSPIDSLEEDLTTPEGVIRAYMNYFYLGNGNKACSLFTADLKKLRGGPDCPTNVEEFAWAILPEFSDSLDVADATRVAMETNKNDFAKGSAGLVIPDGPQFFETFELVKRNNQWRINSLGSTSSEPTN